MKRGIIVAAAAISVTGAASANLFTTSAPVPAQPSPRGKPAAATEAPVSPAAPAPAAPGPAAQRASVDVRQAPVPMQPKPRAPVVSAWDYPNEIYAKAGARRRAVSPFRGIGRECGTCRHRSRRLQGRAGTSPRRQRRLACQGVPRADGGPSDRRCGRRRDDGRLGRGPRRRRATTSWPCRKDWRAVDSLTGQAREHQQPPARRPTIARAS
jgi:hypothetical protein